MLASEWCKKWHLFFSLPMYYPLSVWTCLPYISYTWESLTFDLWPLTSWTVVCWLSMSSAFMCKVWKSFKNGVWWFFHIYRETNNVHEGIMTGSWSWWKALHHHSHSWMLIDRTESCMSMSPNIAQDSSGYHKPFGHVEPG